ncbi:hypothetical protein AB0H12_23685 [Actinosynnema sp. NPDC023794]
MSGIATSAHALPVQRNVRGRPSARPTALTSAPTATTSVSSTWYAPKVGTGTTPLASAYVPADGRANRSSAVPFQRCATGYRVRPEPSRPSAQPVLSDTNATSENRACEPSGTTPTAFIHTPPRCAGSSGRVAPETQSWPAASTPPPPACRPNNAE